MTKVVSLKVNSDFRSKFSDDVWSKYRHLLEPLSQIDLPKPCGYYVQVVQYIKPEKTSGGIILTQKTLKEDEYQGRVGVVIGMGPECYPRDKSPSGRYCQVGQTVMWPAYQNTGSSIKYKGVVLTWLPDDKIIGVDINAEFVE